jgi:hypothetical protein
MANSHFSFRQHDVAPAWLDWLPRLYAPLLLLLCATYANRPLGGDIDTWAHAAIGRWIWQHGQVPEQSLFLWGAEPIRWIAHSWLSQLTFYALLQSGGAGLVIAFNVACAVAVFALLWRFWTQTSRPNFLTVVLFAVALSCSAPRFYPRPELFTALFLTLLLLFLSRRTQTLWHRQSTLGAGSIVLIFALWANFHGAVAIGLVILVLTLLADAVQDRLDERWRFLLIISICGAAATFLNPYGMELWQALRAVKSETFQAINEWKPFWKWPPLDPAYAIAEAVLVVSALAAWFGNRQRRWAHLLWLLFAAASFISARRNLWVLAIVCLVVLAYNSQVLDTDKFWLWWRRRRDTQSTLDAISTPATSAEAPASVPVLLRTITRISIVLCLIVGVARSTPWDFWKFRTVSKKAPVALSRFFKVSRLQGRVFNDYEYSSYWQWSFGGKPPLFVDLLNAYPDRLLDDYFQVLDRKPRGLKILQRVEIVLLRPARPEERITKFGRYLDSQPQNWARIYRREDGAIWVRRIPKYRYLWSRLDNLKKTKKLPVSSS